MPLPRVITFDVFSALIDSRSGGGAALEELAARRSWPVSGTDVYSRWDAINKESQRTCRSWVTFRELSRLALAETYRQLALPGDAVADAEWLLASVADWPLWPDAASGLARLAGHVTVGVLSNIDDDIFARTRVANLVNADHAYTSERLRAYKPAPPIYREAARRAGDGFVHVASSARDVRGALEAGIPTIRMRRPGHRLDPAGPVPEHTASGMSQILDLLSPASPAS
ncbi:MAG TPA: HAD family hydrolase [Streptosporangiaceae bacterium]|jgi:2-haloalkanoic acid dehalogenase type II